MNLSSNRNAKKEEADKRVCRAIIVSKRMGREALAFEARRGRGGAFSCRLHADTIDWFRTRYRLCEKPNATVEHHLTIARNVFYVLGDVSDDAIMRLRGIYPEDFCSDEAELEELRFAMIVCSLSSNQ